MPRRALKPVNGVNNLFYGVFIWFYVFWLFKIDFDRSDRSSLFLSFTDKSGLIGLF